MDDHPLNVQLSYRFSGLNTVKSLQDCYRDKVKQLERMGGTFIALDDKKIEQLGVSFAIARTPDRHGQGYHSPWEVMFFDGASVLTGEATSPDFDPSEVFNDPRVFHSRNETLGNMFRFFALRLDSELIV